MDSGFGETVRQASHNSSDRWLLAWAVGYGAIGASSLLIPLYALELGGGPFIAGALEATAGLAGVPGALIWGYLADRTGQRRTFVLLSLGGSGFALGVVPFIQSLRSLLVINTVLWFLVAAATPVVTLFMIERAAEREWEARIGLLNAYQRYGWVGGLLVGTAWLGMGSRLVPPLVAQQSFFIVCAIAALGATPLAFYWLPPEATISGEQLARSPRSVYRLVAGSGRYLKLIPFAPARAVFAVRGFRVDTFKRKFSSSLRRYFLTAFVFSMGGAMFFGPAPALLTDLGYSSAIVFVFFILASFASALLFVPVGRIAVERHPKSLQITALGVRTLLFPAIGFVALLPGIYLRSAGIGLGFIILGVTWAIIAVTGAGLVSRSSTQSLRGEALGVFTALSGIGGGTGGLLGGFMALRFGYQVTFSTAGGILLVSGLILAGTRFEFLSRQVRE